MSFAQWQELQGITKYSMNISAIDSRRLRTSFNGMNPLDPDGLSTEFYTPCIFPVSGQYGFTPRILYYTLIVFVLNVCLLSKWVKNCSQVLSSTLTSG